MQRGKHIKILGQGNSDKLNDASEIHAFLLAVIELAGMRRLMGPHVCSVDLQIAKMHQDPFDDEGGVTGVVVLSTSHAAIHTWPLQEFFVFDMYSCRTFNDKVVEAALVSAFGAYRMRVHDFSESLNY